MPCRLSILCWLLVSLLACAGSGHAAPPEAAQVHQTWQILDYLAVDYPGAVQDGKVLSASEYAEMREFAATVKDRIAALPATRDQADLSAQAQRLVAAIEAKVSPSEVAGVARGLADGLLASYPVDAVPSAAPDVAAAAPIYARTCAGCHGASGHADGPAAANLNPPPIDFTDQARAARRSPFALYEAISQGIRGTSMPSFESLPAADRWALAFYVGTLATDAQARNNGESLWAGDLQLRSQVPSLESLARTREADVIAAGHTPADAHAVLGYLHANPAAVVSAGSAAGRGPLAVARARMSDSLKVYQSGDADRARTAALSAYLDGVEPVEPALGVRDADLKRELENAMARYRDLINRRAPASDVAAQAASITTLFERTESVLADSHAGRSTAFLGSFTILLREGIEALLIVIGMIAFLRKAERRDSLPAVHAGWIGALLAGVATWAVATHLVDVSGANREVTEGLSALFAAVVLLSVGIWMHQKSLAGRWQQYLQAKVSAALTRRSAIFLFVLAFVAVYREVFETILFFIAMWSQENSGAILGGLIAGGAVLAAVAFWMLRMSQRLPIARFFSLSSILIAVLAVVLVGKGVAALQEAGWIGQALVPAPRIDWLGVYPSWQSLTTQAVIAVMAALGFYVNTRGARALAPAMSRSGP